MKPKDNKSVKFLLIENKLYIQPTRHMSNKMLTWCAHKLPIFVFKKDFAQIGEAIKLAINMSNVYEEDIEKIEDIDAKLIYDVIGLKNQKQIAKKDGLFLTFDISSWGMYYTPSFFDRNYSFYDKDSYVYVNSLEPAELEEKMWLAFEKCKSTKR